MVEDGDTVYFKTRDHRILSGVLVKGTVFGKGGSKYKPPKRSLFKTQQEARKSDWSPYGTKEELMRKVEIARSRLPKFTPAQIQEQVIAGHRRFNPEASNIGRRNLEELFKLGDVSERMSRHVEAVKEARILTPQNRAAWEEAMNYNWGEGNLTLQDLRKNLIEKYDKKGLEEGADNYGERLAEQSWEEFKPSNFAYLTDLATNPRLFDFSGSGWKWHPDKKKFSSTTYNPMRTSFIEVGDKGRELTREDNYI